MLMQNIEDYGFVNQLGKERFGIDYWLSYPGPSYLFEETGKEKFYLGDSCNLVVSLGCLHNDEYYKLIATVFEDNQYADAFAEAC